MLAAVGLEVAERGEDGVAVRGHQSGVVILAFGSFAVVERFRVWRSERRERREELASLEPFANRVPSPTSARILAPLLGPTHTSTSSGVLNLSPSTRRAPGKAVRGAIAVIHLSNERSIACPHQRFTHPNKVKGSVCEARERRNRRRVRRQRKSIGPRPVGTQ